MSTDCSLSLGFSNEDFNTTESSLLNSDCNNVPLIHEQTRWIIHKAFFSWS